VKDLKQISTRLARMFAMLAGKTTPDRATMLHSEFPDLPYLARQLSGGETWTDPQGCYPSGCRLTNGGIGT
jgi:hypothetical protein